MLEAANGSQIVLSTDGIDMWHLFRPRRKHGLINRKVAINESKNIHFTNRKVARHLLGLVT